MRRLRVSEVGGLPGTTSSLASRACPFPSFPLSHNQLTRGPEL